MIKSPLNYVGGKYKLLSYILPKINQCDLPIIDLFCGGANVSINSKSKYVWLNDSQFQLIGLLQWMYEKPLDEQILAIDDLIDQFKLSRENASNYYDLRVEYNENLSPDKLYTLIAHSFSNQIRFNRKDEFNVPFGKRTFNDRLRKNYVDFVTEMKTKLIYFSRWDFSVINEENVLYYVDPPYSNGVATYNENGSWSEQDDLRLFEYLKDKKFVMSNAFQNNGKSNKNLMVWAEKFNYEVIPMDYKGSNYQRKNKGETVEVLIWNL